MNEQELTELIRAYPQLMADLRMLRDVGPPAAYIGAGYIRGYVWDVLHGYEPRGLHQDIDVVYYDPDCLDEGRDLEFEHRLREVTGDQRWSVKNQARMHERNGDAPYTSLEDALSRWPETATAVAARIDADNAIQLCVPYGVADLFSMSVRQSPMFPDHDYYEQRLTKKNWREAWPKLVMI